MGVTTEVKNAVDRLRGKARKGRKKHAKPRKSNEYRRYRDWRGSEGAVDDAAGKSIKDYSVQTLQERDMN